MKNSDDESDGEEIANQKMMSDYGISMEEAKKLENMSDKEIEQWASSYSQRSTGAAKNKSLQSRNAETYASNAKINELENQFSTYVDKWSRMGLELERQEKLADADLKVALEKVKKGAPEPKYVGEACVNQKAIDEYFAKNEPPCYDAYCNRVNPLWIQHLNQKKADMPKMFDLLDQILTLKNNLLKEESGIKIQNSILTETAKLALVKEYANEMRSGGPATRATKE
ncbi:MAG TPA: hypothetical protein VHO72_17880 [Bacteroidales bacterium]|nr:hypothetical protein [Bacteroidales bacterium]